MKTYQAKLLAGCSILTIVAGGAGLAQAQSSAAASQTTIAPVIVTARKKSEDLLKTPVAVTALTSKDIEERGVITLDDVANFTPGMMDDQSSGGSARSDRSFQSIIIRGMNPSTTQNPTTAIFINGTPVASPSQIQNIDDVDHVEVLKGPQSAYFGRDTFAGALNIVTKQPSNSAINGYISVEEGTRNTHNFAFDVNGPLIQDKLSFDAGAAVDGHDGSYKNEDSAVSGQNLGAQSTSIGHVAIAAHPIENLSIKAYGQYLQDNDGPGATGVLLTTQTGSIPGQANCQINALPYFCGTLPGLTRFSPAANTLMTPAIASYLASPDKTIRPADAVKGFGLKRDAYHVDLDVDYQIPSIGVTLTSLTAFNYEAWSELSDLANLDGPATTPAFYGGAYPGFAFMVEQKDHDFSQEVRIATNQSLPYRATVGFSYLQARTDSGLGGPEYGGFFSSNGTTGSKTSGAFFSLAYDVLPQLTVDFDGRYQVDEEYSDYPPGVGPTNQAQFDTKYYNFVPRAIIQYKFTPDIMTYFTYSEGVNPGTFNSQIAGLAGTISPNAYKFFTGTLTGGSPYDAKVVNQPEKLSNYELGVKGKFLDGRATLSADIYYDKWTNQLVSRGQTLPAGYTYDGYVINPTAVPQLVGWTDNSAESTMRGVELDGKLLPVEHVIINAAAALSDARYDKYTCIPCATYLSSVPINTDGKQLPNQSKYSATIGIEYTNTMDYLGAKSWYVRGDFVYKSGFFLEQINTFTTPDEHLLNLHGGIDWQQVSLEGFVNNLLNQKYYTSGFPDDNFTHFTGYYNAAFVGLSNLITFGAKIKYKF